MRALLFALCLASPAVAEDLGAFRLDVGPQSFELHVDDSFAGNRTSWDGATGESASFIAELAGITAHLGLDGSDLGETAGLLEVTTPDGLQWTSLGRPLVVTVTRRSLAGSVLHLDGLLRGAIANGSTVLMVGGHFSVDLPPIDVAPTPPDPAPDE